MCYYSKNKKSYKNISMSDYEEDFDAEPDKIPSKNTLNYGD